jgi:hypothetical protein
VQIFLTIISGVVVYVLGQIILNFVLEPIKAFNKERGDASFLMLSLRAKIANASNADPKIQSDIKEVAAALISTMAQIPCYSLMRYIFSLPSKQHVFEGSREIVGISHGIGLDGKNTSSPQQNLEAARKIARLLKIKTSYDLS